MLLAAEFLKQSKSFIEEGLHPQIMIRSLRKACELCLKKIEEIAVKIDKSNKEELRNLLEKCAQTTLSSKLIAQQKQFFSKLVVDAVMQLDELLPSNMIEHDRHQEGAGRRSGRFAARALRSRRPSSTPVSRCSRRNTRTSRSSC